MGLQFDPLEGHINIIYTILEISQVPYIYLWTSLVFVSRQSLYPAGYKPRYFYCSFTKTSGTRFRCTVSQFFSFLPSFSLFSCFFFFFSKKILCISVCVYYAPVCRCQQRPEGIRFSGTGITGGSESPHMGARN